MWCSMAVGATQEQRWPRFACDAGGAACPLAQYLSFDLIEMIVRGGASCHTAAHATGGYGGVRVGSNDRARIPTTMAPAAHFCGTSALAPPPLSELLHDMPRPVVPTNGAREHGWEEQERRQLATRQIERAMVEASGLMADNSAMLSALQQLQSRPAPAAGPGTPVQVASVVGTGE